MPGLYFRNPIIWQVKKYAITEILEDQVGVVESIDGEALPKARLLGDAVESAHFQDGEAFLDNHGKRGRRSISSSRENTGSMRFCSKLHQCPRR